MRDAWAGVGGWIVKGGILVSLGGFAGGVVFIERKEKEEGMKGMI